MTIGSVNVYDIVGSRFDVIIAQSKSLSPFTIEYDFNGHCKVMAQSVYNGTQYEAHVDVSDVFRGAFFEEQDIGYTVYVTESGISSSAQMFSSVANGWDDAFKGRGTVSTVWSQFGEHVTIYTGDSCEVYNQDTDTWDSTNAWYTSLYAEYFRDGYIHMRAQTVAGYMIRVQGWWYHEPEPTGVYYDGHETWKWMAVDPAAPEQAVYTLSDTPAVEAPANYYDDFSGQMKIVTAVQPFEFVSELRRGYYFDFPEDIHYYNIAVRVPSCQEGVVWIAFTDSDGVSRYIASKMVDAVEKGTGRRYTYIDYSYYSSNVVRQGNRYTNQFAEITLGVADVKRGIALEDLLRTPQIEIFTMRYEGLNPGWQIYHLSTNAALLTDDIDFTQSEGDIKLTFAL